MSAINFINSLVTRHPSLKWVPLDTIENALEAKHPSPEWPFLNTIVDNLANKTIVETNQTKEPKVLLTHIMGANNKGGVSIAYRRASPFSNCRMVEVSVAYCSPHDTFSKKVGASLALSRFEDEIGRASCRERV